MLNSVPGSIPAEKKEDIDLPQVTETILPANQNGINGVIGEISTKVVSTFRKSFEGHSEVREIGMESIRFDVKVKEIDKKFFLTVNYYKLKRSTDFPKPKSSGFIEEDIFNTSSYAETAEKIAEEFCQKLGWKIQATVSNLSPNFEAIIVKN